MFNKNFSTPQITANTTPQLFITGTDYSGNEVLRMLSLGANTCYIGNSASVSSTTGFPLSNTIFLETVMISNVYIICAAGTCNVAAMVIH